MTAHNNGKSVIIKEETVKKQRGEEGFPPLSHFKH